MHEDNKKLFENNLHKKLKTLSNSSSLYGTQLSYIYSVIHSCILNIIYICITYDSCLILILILINL